MNQTSFVNVLFQRNKAKSRENVETKQKCAWEGENVLKNIITNRLMKTDSSLVHM